MRWSELAILLVYVLASIFRLVFFICICIDIPLCVLTSPVFIIIYLRYALLISFGNRLSSFILGLCGVSEVSLQRGRAFLVFTW